MSQESPLTYNDGSAHAFVLPGRVASMLRGAGKWLSAVLLLEKVGRPGPIGAGSLVRPWNKDAAFFAIVHE